MRVLLVTNGYPPRRWAGTETYTAGLAEELQKRGHRVQVLCAGDWDTGKQYWNGYSDEIHRNVPVRRLHFNWTKSPDPFTYLYNNPVVQAYLSEYLTACRPELVHVTSCETLSASVLQAVRRASVPLVLSLTDFWFLCPRINLVRGDENNCTGATTPWDCLQCQLRHGKAYQWPARLLTEAATAQLLTKVSRHPFFSRRRGLRGLAGDMASRKAFLREALRWPDCRITASSFTRDLFVSNGVASLIKVQPYGHDLTWMNSYRGTTASSVLRIGFVGQIVKEKGVHLLLQAAGQLQKQGLASFALRIWGDLQKVPGYTAELRTIASNLQDIEFRGTYPHEGSAEVFAGIDVLVVPSLWYDFPLIIYEAFATGTPVVATNLGGMAEAVTHGLSGLLFERANPFDLAQQLKRILSEPDLLDRLKAGIPRVKTVQEEVTELEALYTELACGCPDSSQYRPGAVASENVEVNT